MVAKNRPRMDKNSEPMVNHEPYLFDLPLGYVRLIFALAPSVVKLTISTPNRMHRLLVHRLQ